MSEKKEIDTSYSENDDIPIGTPVYAGGMGGGIVRIPIKKEERIKFEQQIEKLETRIRHLEEINDEFRMNLSWRYKRRLRKKKSWKVIYLE